MGQVTITLDEMDWEYAENAIYFAQERAVEHHARILNRVLFVLDEQVLAATGRNHLTAAGAWPKVKEGK
jgi:hypothetical protein